MARTRYTSMLVALGLLLAAAGPAAAQECETDTCLQAGDPNVLLAGGTSISRATFGPVFSVASSTVDQTRAQTLSQSASGEVTQEHADVKDILVQCAANSLPSGVATGIVQCYLESKGKDHARYDAVDPDANPGPLDATVSQVITVPTDRYKVCVQSRVLFSDASFFESPLVCS